MSVSGKKAGELTFKASKNIDWDGMAQHLFSDVARKEFATLRNKFEEYNHLIKTKYTVETEPIDWDFYRKAIGSKVIDKYKEAFESLEIPKYEDTVTPKFLPIFEEMKKELKAAEEESYRESEKIAQRKAEAEELCAKLSTMTVDEYLEKYPELRKKFDDERRNDYWGY